MDNFNLENQEMKCNFPNCGKILSSKYNLKRHIESCHNGIRPYECSICYKRFSSKQNKREHVRLEHSYSISGSSVPKNSNSLARDSISIPKLSSMLRVSQDPDIRPLSKIERIYLYADLADRIELPDISESRKYSCTLPILENEQYSYRILTVY